MKLTFRLVKGGGTWAERFLEQPFQRSFTYIEDNSRVIGELFSTLHPNDQIAISNPIADDGF